MRIDLHSLKISLTSNDKRVVEQWQQLFSYEIVEDPSSDVGLEPDIALTVEVQRSLPPLPSLPYLYKSKDSSIIVYNDQAKQLSLRYANAGQVRFGLPDHDKVSTSATITACIVLAETSVSAGALESLTGMALAPLLRRKGLFLIHAFAAAFAQEAILFAGPSGSGKTSSGLALLAAGWQYLANDLAIIHNRDDRPHALLSPGTIQITPTTFTLIPQLKKLINYCPDKTTLRKIPLPRETFIRTNKIVRSAPISIIVFPSVGKSAVHQFSRVPRAVGYARLMASSMDQWDQDIWAEHLIFLEQLSKTVTFYDLSLGTDMAELPCLLRNLPAGT